MNQSDTLSILIVDDDQIDRMTVKRALSKAKNKINVSEATGFIEATELLKNETFDCLLFDYRLGGQNGLDLIKEIQNLGLSQAPIVMLSGLDDEDVMLNCLKEGAQDFLLKSEITTNSLVRAIRYAQERKQIAIQMRFLAQHDTLTGLANRSLFIDSVEKAVLHAKEDSSNFAVIFIDIDHFKSVNDTLGHEAGDELLTTIAHRIKSTIRREDIVGRLGGDEFSVLIKGIAKQEYLINISQQLLSAIREPVIIYNKTVHPSISIGIVSYPNCAGEAQALIRCADLAMYKAKQCGRNNYCFYSEDLQKLADEYANLKIDLHNALEHNEFELFYQPQINSYDGTISGVEALIRWNHPIRGLVSPDSFIAVAESVGLINAIGDWVIEEACRQLKIWLSDYSDTQSKLIMAINVSAHQIRQYDLKEKICSVIKKYNIPYDQIEIELTESALIEDIDQCAEKLQSLSQLGIHLAIDDFGTGFASFQHLQKLPLDTLKIDKIFIDDICTKEKSLEIVKAMMAIAKALNMSVVAEGVELEEQAKLLSMLNCDKLQGYYFSKPLPPHEIEKLFIYSDNFPDITHSISHGIFPSREDPPDKPPPSN